MPDESYIEFQDYSSSSTTSIKYTFGFLQTSVTSTTHQARRGLVFRNAAIFIVLRRFTAIDSLKHRVIIYNKL